jgi:hypothetical protein
MTRRRRVARTMNGRGRIMGTSAENRQFVGETLKNVLRHSTPCPYNIAEISGKVNPPLSIGAEGREIAEKGDKIVENSKSLTAMTLLSHAKADALRALKPGMLVVANGVNIVIDDINFASTTGNVVTLFSAQGGVYGFTLIESVKLMAVSADKKLSVLLRELIESELKRISEEKA